MLVQTSSGAIAVTAGVQKVTGPGYLCSAQLIGGSAAGTLTIYDGTSTAGILLGQCTAAIGASNSINFECPMIFQTGLFVVVAGTASVGIVGWSLA